MLSGARILIADDDVRLASLVSSALEVEGYRVDLLLDGGRVVERALSGDYELAILDWMLPQMLGIDCCRAIRAESTLPIIMLTARSQESDVVRALEVGADDYIVKPLRVAEVVMRVRALLRRSDFGRPDAQLQAAVLRVGALEIDARRRRATITGMPLELTSTEFNLLAFLAQRPDEVIGRAEIQRHLWQTDSVGKSRSCDFHVRNLRRKIGLGATDPVRILTVHGQGYQLTS